MSRRKTHTYSTGPVGGMQTKIRVTEATQCASKCFMSDLQCQGVHNHPGAHWAYSPCGTFEYWNRRKDMKGGGMAIASGSIPPGHKDYPDAVNQQTKYFRAFNRYEKIGEFMDDTPPEVVKKLNRKVKRAKARRKRKA